ncbi:hypothetical protein JVT61DRAFT_7509 [Boletus reticuloceps]|uniref:Uncharacterized protein n=1 Tax=Boletus reticuloceps TaxID=495285 RepID=A0A8I2YIZ0_9AGAM|nr:hypothetical protein JVT61DRAFT_7509 [Boletus reticuloceps]
MTITKGSKCPFSPKSEDLAAPATQKCMQDLQSKNCFTPITPADDSMDLSPTLSTPLPLPNPSDLADPFSEIPSPTLPPAMTSCPDVALAPTAPRDTTIIPQTSEQPPPTPLDQTAQ